MRLSGGRGSRAAAAARAKAPGCGRAWQTGAMAQEPSRLQQGQKDEPWKMKPERLWGRRPSVGSVASGTGERLSAAPR